MLQLADAYSFRCPFAYADLSIFSWGLGLGCRRHVGLLYGKSGMYIRDAPPVCCYTSGVHAPYGSRGRDRADGVQMNMWCLDAV